MTERRYYEPQDDHFALRHERSGLPGSNNTTIVLLGFSMERLMKGGRHMRY
jgi:hypothetical protein